VSGKCNESIIITGMRRIIQHNMTSAPCFRNR